MSSRRDSDGGAETVRLSGTCDRVANCTFSALVQDNGEPGRDDQFGVTVVLNGEVVEEQAMRQVRNGNIQFHTSTLETEVNAGTLRGGQTLRLSAHLRRDRTVATPADAYVVLRLPSGQMMSWTGTALVPGLVPLVRNFVPVDFDGTLLELQVPPGTPAGTYTWMSVAHRRGHAESAVRHLRADLSRSCRSGQPSGARLLANPAGDLPSRVFSCRPSFSPPASFVPVCWPRSSPSASCSSLSFCAFAASFVPSCPPVFIATACAMIRWNNLPASPVLAGAFERHTAGLSAARMSAKSASGVFTDSGANSVMSTGPGPVVAMLDQQPAWLRSRPEASGADEHPGSLELVAVERELQIALAERRVDVRRLGRPGAAVPEHHDAGAVALRE